jgi:hypothetical protein
MWKEKAFWNSVVSLRGFLEEDGTFSHNFVDFCKFDEILGDFWSFCGNFAVLKIILGKPIGKLKKFKENRWILDFMWTLTGCWWSLWYSGDFPNLSGYSWTWWCKVRLEHGSPSGKYQETRENRPEIARSWSPNYHGNCKWFQAPRRFKIIQEYSTSRIEVKTVKKSRKTKKIRRKMVDFYRIFYVTFWRHFEFFLFDFFLGKFTENSRNPGNLWKWCEILRVIESFGLNFQMLE